MNDLKRENSINLQTKRKSLLQKHFLVLRPCEIWCLLRKKTALNSTLIDCIQSGLDYPDDLCGLYATDGDCYELFRSLFWPIIMEYHRIDLQNLIFKHDFGDATDIDDLPSEFTERISLIDLRIHRSIQGYPMIPKLTQEQFLEIEERLRYALDDLQGEYHPINEIHSTEFQDKSFRFPEPTNRYLESVGLYNHWPTGRGIFVNENANLIIWINEEDHLTFISQTNENRMNETYERLIQAIEKLNQSFVFQQHPRLGYLNCSPKNLGTAFQINVRIKLFHIEKLSQMIEKLDLRLEKTNENQIYNLSNLIQLGRTEFHIVRSFWDGIQQIIEEDLRE